MEAPHPPPDPVVPSVANVPVSRLGPGFGSRVGVFQPVIYGKYHNAYELPSLPDCLSDFSILHTDRCNRFAADLLAGSSLPGRNVYSISEAPHPSDAVEPPAASVHHSRPGPAVGTGGGVFLPADSDKYLSSGDGILPVVSRNSSGFTPLPSPTEHTTLTRSTVRKGLLVFYQNVRGLRTKIDDFIIAVAESNFDIIVLTETWLDEKIYSAQLFGDSFTVFRCDRSSHNSSKSRGGGVLIAVSTRLSASSDPSPICNTLEQIWIRVKLPGHTMSVGVIYLPPDRKGDLNSIEDHISSIEAVYSDLSLSVFTLLFGDYNQSGLVWNFPGHAPPAVDSLRSNISVACAALLDGFSLHGLTQINTAVNRNSRLLDLVLVNESATSFCSVHEAVNPVVPLDADHPAVEVLVDLPVSFEFEDIVDASDLDFRRANFSALAEAISRVDWSCLDHFANVNNAVCHFTQTMKHLISDCVPTRRPPRKPAWGDAHLRFLKRLRSSALRKYSKLRCPFSKRQFNIASNNYRAYNLLLYKRYTLRMQSNLRRNPRSFWSFVNSKKNEVGLPVNMFLGTVCANTAVEKCELFATHFKNSFNTSVASEMQTASAIRDTPCDAINLNIFHINDQLVETAIKKLKYSFAAGSDGIPSCVLKKCAAAIVRPLVLLFETSLRQNVFPESWKKFIMFPVHKKGDKRNVENYRGITSLCACSKLLEIIVHDALFMCSSQYLSVDQHGFFPRSSVATNLTQFVSFCLNVMEENAQVDVVYTDLKAAFDRVDHAILLNRMEKLEISVAFIRCVISFYRKLNPITFDYSILGHALQRVNHIRDLGVNLDCALTFRLHFEEIISKANRQLGFIFKIDNEFRDPFCLRSLYCALVRSLLETCSIVWCPFQANWMARIEAVQKKFVRYALRMLPWSNLLDLPPYENRCKLLGLETLEKRRTTAQVVFVAKLLIGHIDCPPILEQLNLYAPERALRTRNFLHLDARRVNYGQFSPIRYMAAQFNTVYELFDFDITIDTFKRRLLQRR
ncbi:uncharacterized protein LOC128735845 [Sabethes cyaneus]|uniref:uncharacterized protein LOC128735845 n=1 Tax=Sabethes cyaneus TaxID=53552 RepID=UPI00237E2B60|nr:uncharacterized protein LOC128735845 [Sabethes cyaneus]